MYHINVAYNSEMYHSFNSRNLRTMFKIFTVSTDFFHTKSYDKIYVESAGLGWDPNKCETLNCC